MRGAGFSDSSNSRSSRARSESPPTIAMCFCLGKGRGALAKLRLRSGGGSAVAAPATADGATDADDNATGNIAYGHREQDRAGVVIDCPDQDGGDQKIEAGLRLEEIQVLEAGVSPGANH